MNTKEVREKINRTIRGEITSPADNALLDICEMLCNHITELDARLVDAEIIINELKR